MKHLNCPSCNSQDIEDFFEVKNAPVFSLVTVKTFDEAIKIPRKDITLSFCNNCGFIYNSLFDTSIDFFTQGYEDQQGFSKTFVNFITGVTKQFIEKYNIKNKTVVEIGSGKGDFIALISELGDNKGIGIDPAWVPGRNKPLHKVSFIKEFYSEKHGDLNADCICCRHTLEHIHNTDDFIGTIKASTVNNGETVVFMEIPSITRILKIQAFWDIFYEHCSYFSPGSLARLFRKNGFEVLDLYIKNDDQYLFIEAKPSRIDAGNIHPLEESIDDLRKMIADFSVKIREQLDSWREKLQHYKASNKKVAIWGGGSKCVGFLTHFNDIGVIKHVVDINPHMTGNFIPGIGIQYKEPSFLAELKPDVIIIMNGVYKDEIAQMLSDLGVNSELLCL